MSLWETPKAQCCSETRTTSTLLYSEGVFDPEVRFSSGNATSQDTSITRSAIHAGYRRRAPKPPQERQWQVIE